MSKFDSCLTSLNLRDSVPVDALRTTAAEYQAEGMEPAAAMLRAVEDQLELAQMEEANIIQTVRSEYEKAGGKKKPEQKAKAQAAKAAEPKPGAVDNTPAPIPEPVAVKPEAKPAAPKKPSAKQRERDAQLDDYFTVGNIVHGYGGLHDRVLGFTPANEENDFAFSVKVQQVVKQDGEWVVDKKDSQIRTHSTRPDKRELTAGPIERAKKAAEPADTLRPSIPRNQRTIEVDGVRRLITNSKGQLVADDFDKQRAFYDWFGKSAVVDGQGQPLVVYHGTASPEFTRDGARRTFRATNGMGEGAYFTPIPSLASDYAAMDAEVGDGNAAVMPVYLSVQNPKIFRGGIDSQSISKEQRAELEASGHDGVFGYDDNGALVEIAVFKPEQIKSATGNDGTFSPDTADITAATSTATSPMDSTVAELVKAGAKVGAVLERIAKDSANPDFRALAQALLAQNLKTTLLFERAKGTYTAGVNASMATAAYKASTDTAYLHQVEGAEANALHELTHAATLKALAKGGLAAQQIKSLWRHVQALPNFAGEYGITNEEEFVAEAFTSPRFRQMLANTPAPGTKISFWDKLVGIVKMLLGKPPVADSVLARVMAAGPGLMAENQSAEQVDDMPAVSPEQRQASFKRWFDGSQVVKDGKPLLMYHGTHRSIASFDTKGSGALLGKGTYLTADPTDASGYAAHAGGNVMPLYVAMKNPFVINDLFGVPERAELEMRGHDGILWVKGDTIKWAVAYQPNQIKSATGNNGDFSASNSDIRAAASTYRLADLPRDMREELFNNHAMFTDPEATEQKFYAKRVKKGMIDIANLTVDEIPEAQLKRYMDADVAALPPLVVADGRLVDGQHRIQAARAKGIAELPYIDMTGLIDTDETGYISEIPEPDLRASITAGTLAQQISSGIDAATLRDIPRVLGNRLKDFRNIGLAALGRRQLVDLYAPDFAPDGKESLLSRYSKLMQQMDADKNEAGAEADGIADRWGKLKDGTQLADLMHDSTLAQIDPAKDHQAGDNRAAWSGLNSRFKALSPEGQKLYTEARDAYNAHWQKVRAEIRGRIERATPDSPRRAALLEKMDATFYEKVKGVYFPLARFGDYVVTVQGKDGTRLSVNFAETMNEADALRKALLKKYPGTDGYVVSKVTKKKEFNAGRDTVSRGFMQELFGVLDQYESGGQLQDDINQLYLASMPDLSWAKHGIHRKGTPGFSQDARRAFAQNMFHGARYLAKLRYGDRLADYLTEMQDHLDSKATDAKYDSVKAQQVVDEMTKRHESYMNPQGNALSSTLTSLGFIFYLGLSPASAAVNLSQTPLVTLPMLAAKYGFGKASAALLEASKQAASNRNDISKALTGDELKAYQDAVAAGVIDVSMAHDLAGIASGDDTRAHAKLRPVMKWASWMFHHGEKFNRQASLMAAYRLARGAGKDHASAYESAVEEVYASHFDYASSNRPRIMQGNVAKVVLLFKQFAQNMIYVLARNAVLAAKGDKVALKTLAGLLTSHALAAGVLGLPIVGTLLAVATALGSDDDEPWDAKVALRNQLADLIGQKPAEVLMHGVSRLGPWDVSGRVGLDKLILPDVQEGLEGARAAEAWMTAALGPVAGIGMSTAKGLNNIAEGNVLRGLEDMLPVSIRNPLKALRFATEGVQDKTGIPIVDDTSALEELGQLIGFSPSRSREAMEGKGAVYQAERKLNDRRAALVAQWAHAKMAGDAEGAAEIRQEIIGFNAKNQTRRITQVNLTSSLRQRNKRIAEAEGGIYLPKKHQDVRELGRFAEQD